MNPCSLKSHFEERELKFTIDLCWVAAGLLDRLVGSEAHRELYHDFDHLPASTSLYLSIKRPQMKPKENEKHLNEKEFGETLRQAFPKPQRPKARATLDRHVKDITTAIEPAAGIVLGRTPPSPRVKEG